MTTLPQVNDLPEAVRAVIRNNQQCGYPPNRFIQLTEHGTAANLRDRCERLLISGGADETLERAVREHPGLILLEDFVVPYGRAWGFSEEAIRRAEEWLRWIEQVTGRPRPAVPSGTD